MMYRFSTIQGKISGTVAILLASMIGIATYAIFTINGLNRQLLELSKNNSVATQIQLNHHSTTLITTITIISILTGIIVTALLIRSLIEPLRRLILATHRFAEGDLHVELEMQNDDEFGELNWALNGMQESMRKVHKTCQEIAHGNLEQSIELRGDKDEIGQVLNEMALHLQIATEENKNRNWLQNGLVQLNNELKSELELIDLTKNAVKFIAKYIGANVGAIYVADDATTLKMIASYAYTTRKNVANEFKLGEGLIGQVALEQAHIVMTELPDNYVPISSGLGEATCRNVVVFPMLYRGVSKGVIELGSFHEFTPHQIAFLDEATINLAVAIHSNDLRSETNKLLTETSKQSEKLQVQQEELRITNEELESQQTELSSVNNELEDQKRELVEQKQNLERKNSELENAKRDVEARAREVEMSNRYKSEFLANMSHELRTPLNSMLILSKLLEENRDENLNKDQIEYAKTIYGSGVDLLNLIGDILDLSKIEAGRIDLEIDDISLEELKSKLFNELNPVAQQKGLSWQIELAPEAPKAIRSDALRLRQILKNLLSNAFKFTHEGGVTLRIGFAPTSKVGEIITFRVSDTGIGIPQELHSTIFEAFRQGDGSTNRLHGGTGLGLAISRQICDILGGQLRLEASSEGNGSTFTLYLPRVLQEELVQPEGTSIEKILPTLKPQVPKLPPPEPDASIEVITREFEAEMSEDRADDRLNIGSGDRVILIIEDDQKFAESILTIARHKGFKGIIAGRGDAGLAYAHKFKPDAIILDLILPVMDGWTVMERLKGHPNTRHIPVHIVSGIDERMRGLRLGAIGYDVKPVLIDDLSKLLDETELFANRKPKRLLVVEDNEAHRASIVALIGNGDVETVAVGTGREAIEELRKNMVDCVVLDLGLPDMSWQELIAQLKAHSSNPEVPIIVYTGKDLSDEEESEIEKHTEAVIIKDVHSPEKLLDETALFLHRVEGNLPPEKRKILEGLHDYDSVFKNKKVLIVDDDMRNVFALTSTLRKYEMEILIAENGHSCLETLKEHSNIELVLMDVMMPGMDGYRAMQEIRKIPAYRSLPIIALTAKAMKGDREKCIDAGASDYISKPADVDQLISLMRVWLYK